MVGSSIIEPFGKMAAPMKTILPTEAREVWGGVGVFYRVGKMDLSRKCSGFLPLEGETSRARGSNPEGRPCASECDPSESLTAAFFLSFFTALRVNRRH